MFLIFELGYSSRYNICKRFAMPAIKKVQSIRNCTFWFPDWTFPTRCTQMSRPVDTICIVRLGEQSWCTKDIMDIPSRSVEVDNPADASWEALLLNMPCGLREAAEQTSMLFGPNCKLFDFVWTAENWIIAVLGPWCCASERPEPPQHPLLRSNLESMYLFQTKDGTVSLLCCGWGTLTWDTLLFEVWHSRPTIQDFT